MPLRSLPEGRAPKLPWDLPLASIPSPSHAAWRLGPLPVRAYALCVAAGITVAVLVASRRYRRSGGRPGVMLDVAAWAVPFGLAGAALHAMLVDARHDFTRLHRLWYTATAGVAAIGVPGAVALGAVGAWIACRRAGLRLGPVADAAAPAVMFGLAIGALGNWWTQQFYGRPSSLWWAVQIAPEHRASGYENYGTFQPAFLYQSLWDVLVGLGVIWAARRFPLPKVRGGAGTPPQAAGPAASSPKQTRSGGRTFMLCAAAYAVGGFWVETVRVGPLPRLLGVRYGAFGDVVVFALAVAGLYLTRPRRTPPARTYDKASMVGDSSGDVMSV